MSFVSALQSYRHNVQNSLIFRLKMSSFLSHAAGRPFLLTSAQMDGLFRHIEELNINSEAYRLYYTFVLRDQLLGYLQPSFVSTLQEVADLTLDINHSNRTIHLSNPLGSQSVSDISIAMASLMEKLKESGKIRGWRNELLPVVSAYGEEPLFLLERAAVPCFGVKAYGVHVNGFLRSEESGVPSHLWVARRSKQKSTWPGMLDHIVAGGQPHGLGLMENVIKECEEEASIPASLACRARPVSAISYNGIDEQGNLKRDALFCYDLELPKEFQPRPLDGEVENFELRDMKWVLDRLLAVDEDRYKPNCNLVIIDFFIRHGLIDPESPRYLQLVAALRAPGCL